MHQDGVWCVYQMLEFCFHVFGKYLNNIIDTVNVPVSPDVEKGEDLKFIIKSQVLYNIIWKLLALINQLLN